MRILLNIKFRHLYSSSNINVITKSRSKQWAEHVTRMRKIKGIRISFGGGPEGKTQLGRLLPR